MLTAAERVGLTLPFSRGGRGVTTWGLTWRACFSSPSHAPSCL